MTGGLGHISTGRHLGIGLPLPQSRKHESSGGSDTMTVLIRGLKQSGLLRMLGYYLHRGDGKLRDKLLQATRKVDFNIRYLVGNEIHRCEASLQASVVARRKHIIPYFDVVCDWTSTGS